MKGIECAFQASIGQDIELKTSKSGKPYVSFSAVVEQGESSQWLRVGCFGDTAERLAGQAQKGDRIYCEGVLTLNTWQGADGEAKTGLNVAAWKCERLGNIGRNRIKAPDPPIALPVRKRRNGLFRKRPAKPESSDDKPFNDPLPF
jgi:single-stranded DNA-binding protein